MLDINTLNVLEKISSTLQELVNEFKTNNSKYNKKHIGEVYIPKFGKDDIIESISNQHSYLYRVSEIINDNYVLEILDDRKLSRMYDIIYVQEIDKFYQ